MKKAKLSDLWQDVEAALSGEKAASIKFAIVESHKILENTLRSQGYPGKTIEKKLYWAGYSLEDETGIKQGLDKRKEILENFEYELSDFEAEEIVKLYKKVVHEIATKEKFGPKDKLRAFYKVYLNPKSIYFWRNLAIIFAIFGLTKILAYSKIGEGIIDSFVYLADIALSWVFVAVVIVVTIVVLIASNYSENRTKIKIKE
ncbi:MAG: hypothetical protein PHW75_02870 [Patescibacteria group bacterium]|nr:hypothetical protein [Patescibacteria group bacterium]